jgi:hypothetical protein
LREELFVERAGDFRDEDRVVVVLKRLATGGIVAVHRVPGLVGQRENIVEHIRLVIHQDVRIAIVSAAAKRSALLPLVGISIAPSSAKPSREDPTVFFSQGFEGIEDNVDCFVPGMVRWDIG